MILPKKPQILYAPMLATFGGGSARGFGRGIDTGPSMPEGLSSSLFNVYGNNAVWTQRTIDVSDYVGHTIRLVFKHQVASSGTVYRADLQLDEITVNGSTYTFENTGDLTGWQTSTSGSYSNYIDVQWSSLLTSTTAERWCRDSGGTASGSTALTTGGDGTSFYLYTETSSPVVNNDRFWLRSPEITLTSSNVSFFEARYGSTIGDFDFYIDVQ